MEPLHERNYDELLGRNRHLQMDRADIRNLVHGKRVLVTGGGGSIGSEICRQVARENPSLIVIFDNYENNAYAIQQELLGTYPNLIVRIGSVTDRACVWHVFDTYRPEVVFHAAAHKHVPLMEDSPKEAVRNNVVGTLNCVRAASEFCAERFVLISTDKAVNPVSVMGATKRLCEMIVQAAGSWTQGDKNPPTVFSAVRFGNVLGSNGSIVPLFERQIASGGPVTVTHPDVTRYFMTVQEAVYLVLQSACHARGGEVFVLDMGEPVRIDDLARRLVRLAGLEPDVDIAIAYTGLRPGDKLFEECLMDEEGLRETENDMIRVARPIHQDASVLLDGIQRLDALEEGDDEGVRRLLRELVPPYTPRDSTRSSFAAL